MNAIPKFPQSDAEAQSASAQWAPHTTPPTSLPPLLEGCDGVSESLRAAVAAVEATILEATRLGCMHTAAEVDFGDDDERTELAHEVWQEALEREEKAVECLLELPEDQAPEHLARVTAYLRARVLYATQPRRWKQVTALEAVELLTDVMPGSENELGGALAVALEALAAVPQPDHMQRYYWNQARDAYFAAQAVANATPAVGEDGGEEAWERAHDAAANAQERWEQLTPPDMPALLEVLRVSMRMNGGPLSRTWQDVDCPWSIRDLLDSRDAAKVILGRCYLHLLRITGTTSLASATPPIATLYPGVVSELGEVDDAKAWEKQHVTQRPYPSRNTELAEWEGPPEFSQVFDAALHCLWDYSAALNTRAKEIVTDYEARGGAFSVSRDGMGEEWFGTKFARDGSPEASAIQELLCRHKPLRKAVAFVIEQRDGVRAEAPASENAQA